MARPSPRNVKPTGEPQNEHCWVLVGDRRARVWCARRLRRVEGLPTSVEFSAEEVIDREERRGDIIGFMHTHPAGRAKPSQRDLNTMHAWTTCFGKPLLCVIDGVDALRGFVFEPDAEPYRVLEIVQTFPRGVVIGVDQDGG